MKKKCFDAYLKQCWHFTPFVASVHGLSRIDAEATVKCIASRLMTKWKEPYSRTCGYLKSRVAIILVRAAHRRIRGARVPASQISVKRPQWEDSVGLHLFR